MYRATRTMYSIADFFLKKETERVSERMTTLLTSGRFRRFRSRIAPRRAALLRREPPPCPPCPISPPTASQRQDRQPALQRSLQRWLAGRR